VTIGQLAWNLMLINTLGLGDDAPFEIKKPRKPTIFSGLPNSITVAKLVCGGMHTVVLATNGTVWTWGCNDEGALGRPGAENVPLQVGENTLKGITDICAGDSHSIAVDAN